MKHVPFFLLQLSHALATFIFRIQVRSVLELENSDGFCQQTSVFPIRFSGPSNKSKLQFLENGEIDNPPISMGRIPHAAHCAV